MTRDYRTIEEVARDEKIGPLHVWAAVRTKGVKSHGSATGKFVVIDNDEWQRFAESEEGSSFLDDARNLANII